MNLCTSPLVVYKRNREYSYSCCSKLCFYIFSTAICLGEGLLNILSLEHFNFVFTVIDVIWMANAYSENLMIISCISRRQTEVGLVINKKCYFTSSFMNSDCSRHGRDSVAGAQVLTITYI